MRAVAIQVAALALLYRVAGPYVAVPMMLYCALSFLLLRFPLFGATAASGLLSPSLRRVRVIGHRGSRLDGVPENSLASFSGALAAGVDMVELDVWLTADGVVAVHHDPTLMRMCGLPDRIDAVEFADLPPLRPSDPAQLAPPGKGGDDDLG